MARTKNPKTNGANQAVSNAATQQAGATPGIDPAKTAEASSAAAKSATTRKARAPKTPAPKLEAVKTEPRHNLVPINLEDEIRQLAYLMSERRGFVPGHENEDWLAAEHEVLQRYRQHSA